MSRDKSFLERLLEGAEAFAGFMSELPDRARSLGRSWNPPKTTLTLPASHGEYRRWIEDAIIANTDNIPGRPVCVAAAWGETERALESEHWRTLWVAIDLHDPQHGVLSGFTVAGHCSGLVFTASDDRIISSRWQSWNWRKLEQRKQMKRLC